MRENFSTRADSRDLWQVSRTPSFPFSREDEQQRRIYEEISKISLTSSFSMFFWLSSFGNLSLLDFFFFTLRWNLWISTFSLARAPGKDGEEEKWNENQTRNSAMSFVASLEFMSYILFAFSTVFFAEKTTMNNVKSDETSPRQQFSLLHSVDGAFDAWENAMKMRKSASSSHLSGPGHMTRRQSREIAIKPWRIRREKFQYFSLSCAPHSNAHHHREHLGETRAERRGKCEECFYC